MIRTSGNPDIDELIQREIRYSQTRASEVMLACIMVGIGVMMLTVASTWSSPQFRLIASVVDQDTAGLVSSSVGASRLIALYINGRHRRSPLIRLLGCTSGFLFWSGVSAGLWIAPAAFGLGHAIFPILAIGELHASGRVTRIVFAADSLGLRARQRRRARTGNEEPRHAGRPALDR